MDLVKHVAPRNVVLVHGEKPKIAALKSRIISELNIPCFDPANHETVKFPPRDVTKVSMSKRLLDDGTVSLDSFRPKVPGTDPREASAELWKTLPHVRTKVVVEGVLVTDPNGEKKLMHEGEVPAALGMEQHKLGYSCLCPIYAVSGTAGVGDNLPENWPTEAFELPNKLPRRDASTEDISSAQQFLQKEVLRQPEKKSRGNLQRVLSLDLERVPEVEVEEGDDICLNLDLEGPSLRHSDQRPSSTQGKFGSSSRSSNVGLSIPRIDLDINVVPDVTAMDNSPELAANPSLSTVVKKVPDAISILHAVRTSLAKWLGQRLVEDGDCIKGGGTLCVRVAPRSHLDSTQDLSPSTESRRPIALLECQWEEEDNAIAHRVLGLLKGIELNIV